MYFVVNNQHTSESLSARSPIMPASNATKISIAINPRICPIVSCTK